MSTLLDEETVTLDKLDFEPGCDCNTPRGKCGADATHMLICISCGQSIGLACIEHTIYVKRSTRTAKHTACGLGGIMRDIVAVVPL